jgi:predicted DNA-binding transcriptional regulator YafY
MLRVQPLIPRVERLHALVEELRVRAPRRMTGDELAARLGVSVRTVERDLSELQGAGVPIVVRRGLGGGYSFDARAELPPVVLTPGEAAALVAALAIVGPRASATAQSATRKLLTALCGATNARKERP